MFNNDCGCSLSPSQIIPNEKKDKKKTEQMRKKGVLSSYKMIGNYSFFFCNWAKVADTNHILKCLMIALRNHSSQHFCFDFFSFLLSWYIMMSLLCCGCTMDWQWRHILHYLFEIAEKHLKAGREREEGHERYKHVEHIFKPSCHVPFTNAFSHWGAFLKELILVWSTNVSFSKCTAMQKAHA